MHAHKDNLPVVAVKLNGAGPYDFLVDTGATVTVVDPALFAELGLKAEGAMKITTAAGATTYSRSRVKEVSVEGLAVEDVKVIGMNAVSGARGILGENFLQHFDLLIDNQHRKITLDAGSELAESFDGERLPITFTEPTGGGAVRSRPMVSLKVPAYSSRPVKLLLDSGVDQVMLTGRGTMQPVAPGNVRLVKTVNGPMTCTSGEDKLDWGKTTMHGVTLVTCESSVANALEEDGLLPTAIFKQIFISHGGAYAIVNPGKRKAGLQEVVAADPLIAGLLR
jgi:predicted aspartyl protease